VPRHHCIVIIDVVGIVIVIVIVISVIVTVSVLRSEREVNGKENGTTETEGK